MNNRPRPAGPTDFARAYATGASLRDVAERFQCSVTVVRRYLGLAGVPLRDRSGRTRAK